MCKLSYSINLKQCYWNLFIRPSFPNWWIIRGRWDSWWLCATGPWTWWRHQMETFFRVTGHLCGEFIVIGEFPAQRPVNRALMFSLICARINGWVNNSEAGDLRRHHAHYDVIVMRRNIALGCIRSKICVNGDVKCQWSVAQQGLITALFFSWCTPFVINDLYVCVNLALLELIDSSEIWK